MAFLLTKRSLSGNLFKLLPGSALFETSQDFISVTERRISKLKRYGKKLFSRMLVVLVPASRISHFTVYFPSAFLSG